MTTAAETATAAGPILVVTFGKCKCSGGIDRTITHRIYRSVHTVDIEAPRRVGHTSAGGGNQNQC